MLAPICLFTYNRFAEIRQTVLALQKNYLSAESDLYIFSDGGKDKESWEKVNMIREYLRKIDGFKSVHIVASEVNKGLANSIIDGVSKVINMYGKAIVIEDDLITSRNFLDFMNQCLDFYETNQRIISISGFSFSNNVVNYLPDVHFGYRASSWGWATWGDRWNKIDWNISDYDEFRRDYRRQYRFDHLGGSDMTQMLKRQMKGKINSWAIRFCYHQFKYGLVDVYPILSKVKNIGFGVDATNNVKRVSRFQTTIDKGENRSFNLAETVEINKKLQAQFKWRHSFLMRLFGKLQTNQAKSTELVLFHPALAPYRIDFFNALQARFSSEFYFSYNNPQEQNFDQECLRSHFHAKFNRLSCGFDFNGRPVRFGIWKILFSRQPNIVLCSEYSQITLAVLAYKYFINKKMRVYTICDDSIPLAQERKGIRKWLRDKSSSFLDGIIYPSQVVGEWHHQNITLKTKTLELPIVHSNKQFRDKLVQSLKNSEQYIRLHNLQNKRVFLYVGRLAKIKNVELLLRGFAIAKQDSDCLVIVGSGDEENNLKSLSITLGIDTFCIFTGRLEGPALYAWYNVAQCFILPSYQEPYGAVVNEALLAGCKVICSRLAGSSALINQCNGVLFNPFDENELALQIKSMAETLMPSTLPLELKTDMMPFSFEEKLIALISQL